MKKWYNKITNSQFQKLRFRELPTFANINLLGPCNVDCYFCLGKDINEIWSQQNQTRVHFSEWNKLTEYLSLCRKAGIQNVYITGQNTDALLYKYLGELINYLQNKWKFDVGIRTNGYLAHKNMDTLNLCRRNVGLSIHTMKPSANWHIMRRLDIPEWDSIIPQIKNVRVSIVLNRHNHEELQDLIRYIATFDNVAYIQVRKICTDTRDNWLNEDAELYERVYSEVRAAYEPTRQFYTADCFDIFGKEVVFWRTVKTSIGSFNYYTDGSYTDDYFVIEGYMRNGIHYPRENTIPKQVKPLEGYWREK